LHRTAEPRRRAVTNLYDKMPHANPGDAPERRSSLSFAQERMFLLEQLTPGVSAYNVPRVLAVDGMLDATALQRALDSVAERHEPLQTTIELVDGAPVPRVHEGRSIDLTVLDLRGDPDGPSRADEFLSEFAWRPFDLERELLLRAALIHLDGGQELLSLVSHHLVSDHASFPILLTELAEVYAADTAGHRPDLAELPITYADFAVWQRERLDGPALEDDLAYWRDRLGGAPERIDLPSDRPRPAVMSYRGDYRAHVLPAAVIEELRAFARSRRVSFFVVLLAAVQTLLHRYTGQEDVVVGSPASGRHHEEILPLIGFFTNTLVLRTSLAGDPTFEELTGRARDTVLGGLAHQDVPFEKVVEALNPKRDLSHTPLFQVLLTHDVALPELRLGGNPVRIVPLPEVKWSRFDLTFATHDRPDGGLEVFVEYSTDLFEPETIDRLLGHLETLLAGVAKQPTSRISRLPLLPPDERKLLLEDWNATQRPLPDGCIHDLVAAQAVATPDKIAVEGGAVRISYADLDSRANQVAHHLRDLGIGPGSLVAVSTERVPEMMVAFLGVLKSGAAYVPIDPTYPPERKAFMLTDSAAPVLLTQEALVARLPESDAAVVCIDRDWPEIAAQPTAAPPAEGDARSLAYVIYTSGSTGVPKGVEIEHRSVVNLLGAMRVEPGLGADDVLVNVTTSAFDLSVPDLYLPLVCGARLVILPRDVALDGRRLGAALDDVGATFMQATPTTWAMLVESGWRGSPGLRIVCGGEALPRALANGLCGLGESLWHMYGPTETTVWSSILQLAPGDGPPPIGGPIANTQFYVVDGSLQPVPIGVSGELLIGGVGAARGYRGRPDLTAEKFVANSFTGSSDERVYRTGDHVRRRADGTIEFLGRLDQQVKLHGFRIELEEIEAVLDGHPEVRASVAAVRETAVGDKLLVGYVVLEPGSPVSTEGLRRHLSASLPAYAVPSVIVPMDALPVTPNGKLDRAALPDPEGARPVLEQPYVEPGTPMEELLVEIWESLLPVDRVGIDDDFFDLGGHSMLALRLVARIQERLGVDLFLTAVFEHPTVRELAEVVASRMVEEADDDGLVTLLDELEAAGA
jgi:amino acid adenylation domain-containing protein